jgi:copper chaperone
MSITTLKIEGMTCEHCERAVKGALERTPGVTRARVDLAEGRATVEYDEAQVSPDDLAAAVTDEGYDAEAAG